ncbi:MAG TPA: hypothetical protein VIV60_31310, partial [Polyangiaceae bacterium]
PKRLTASSDTPSEIARILRSARRDAPPPDLRRTAWRALAAKSAAAGLAIGAGTVTSKGSELTASTAAGSASTGVTTGATAMLSKGAVVLALKAAVITAGAGAGTFAAHQALVRPPPHSSTVITSERSRANAPEAGSQREAMVPPSNASTSNTGVESSAATLPATQAAATNTRASDRTSPMDAARAKPRPREDRAASARLEAQRVAEVRRMLRSGNGPGALEALTTLDRQLSTHLLEQERAALRIDTLLQMGRRAEATSSIQRFRAQYPRSPLAERWSTAQARSQK